MNINAVSYPLRSFALALLAALALPAMGQELRTAPAGGPTPIKDATLDVAPGIVPIASTPGSTPEALWDVQFNYDATAAVPTATGGMAGVTHIGTEFWVSKWGSDTLYRFSNAGAWLETVLIPGLSGVRSMTWDGTFIYASNNTATISKINPATKTVVGTITAPISQVRMISYDPTLASGAGGLYIANFNTDITIINMSGTTLGVIAAATHTLTGMYGCAYDPYSSGGPFLWVFAQSGTPSNVMLHQLQLPGGTPTGIVHDAMSDVGAAVSGGLAGGMFVSNSLVAGKNTIGGLMQGAPNLLFGYELADPPPVDGAISDFRSAPCYTQIPLSQNGPIAFSARVSSAGSGTIADPRLVVHVSDGVSTIWADTFAVGPLGAGTWMDLVTGSFIPPGLGSYTATGYVITVGEVDGLSVNDSSTFLFEITDSTYARDNGVPTGTNYSVIGAGDWAYATCLWNLPNADTLTGVWISLNEPVNGDTTYAVVYNTFMGEPTTPITTGIPVIIDGATNEYELRFFAPVILAAGEYAIGVYESFDSTINLNQSSLYHTVGMNHYYTNAAGWVPSNIATARFIRPHFGKDFPVSVENPLQSAVAVYPNPTHGNVSVGLSLPSAEEVTITVMDAQGQVVATRQLGEVRSTATLFELGQQASGIYLVQVKAGTQVSTHKVVLQK
jgi:hypothetical protein